MPAFDIRNKKTAPQRLDEGETGRVSSAGSLKVAVGPAVSMAGDSRLAVSGEVVVGDGPALFADGVDIRLSVADTGYVRSPYNYAVYFRNSYDFDIRNAGTLSSGLTALFFSAANSGSVENSGLITGAIGIDAFYQWYETLTLKNSGLIVGDGIAVRQTGGAMHLTNDGRIATRSDDRLAPAIVATAEDDVILNRGRIDGATRLGGGANSFDGRDGVQDAVIGGAGDDRILGGARGDELFGGAGGNDRLSGGGGDDVLVASKGASRLYGDGGNDRLEDAAGDDRLYGGAGRDTLVGKAGADILDGGAGDDRLFAGTGTERLTGGAGDDLFVFRTVSTAGRGAVRDTITDFMPGDDRIDLSDIGRADSFDFVGRRAFSQTPFELRYDRSTGVVSGDVDGDGRADFELRLTGGPTLGEGDFIL